MLILEHCLTTISSEVRHPVKGPRSGGVAFTLDWWPASWII